MSQRGRPPITRARVLSYWRKHGPCSLGQVMRATGIERSQLKRILLQEKARIKYGDAMEIPDEIRARFFSKVDMTPGHGPHGDCWIWTGSLDSYGYARGPFFHGRQIRGTHLALAIDGRPRPSADLIALHSCDNRPCVNPSHLRWGTDVENAEDHRQRVKRGPRWLPDEVVHEILKSPERNIDIARRLGITAPAVCNIRKGRAHRDVFEHYYPVPE